MNRRRSRPDLFAGIGHNSPPAITRESDQLYAAVLFLRIYGPVPVYRMGREHLVGGRQLSRSQMLRLARAECRRVTGHQEVPLYALHRLGFYGAVTPLAL
jgi:hypothetical protein